MSNVLIEYLSNIWYIGDWFPVRYDTYNEYLKTFERRLKQQYPLGEDTFSISHGKNYFNFFRRLGEPFYYAMFDGDKVVGTVCYVYRKIRGHYIMYLCDLKFDKSIRSKGNMSKLLYRTIPTCLFRTTQFYAISMNDDPNSENRVLQMGRHIGDKYNVNVQSGGILNIYSLNFEQMTFVHDLVVFSKASTCAVDRRSDNIESIKIAYVSMTGTKDLIVKKRRTGEEAPLKLLHLYYVEADNISDTFRESRGSRVKFSFAPLKDHTHMFCTPSDSSLAQDLASFDVYPSSTATIIHHAMNDFNWELIQTCDI
ncbi:hypothetical protein YASMINEVIRUS_1247 [Yasminevirus sp. GU-2018]|uniref:Uncharacterized protein n=1 Tax=Yasminevirus sp. GU-2018 TaxID=2420051 RepID=A0A5K0UAG4_9VIRU|nr:hypothetical protein YASMINEVIRUS_1247 [Yasminevirus sp. GU-2018]